MDSIDALSIIAYYLSEFDTKAVEQLGYGSRSKVFEYVSALFNKNGNYLKRLRDEYDVVTNSYRKGQRNRTPRKRIALSASKLKNYNFEELTSIVEGLISEAISNRDKIESAVDANLASEISDLTFDKLIPKFEYHSIPKKKAKPVIISGYETYPRDRKVSLNALSCADYLCEVDASHPTFIRKNCGVRYTEPHHLIPMSFSYMFEHSLDVEENIVSLCSNCHNQIHYGRDACVLVKELYMQRKDLLAKVGLKITLDKLLTMYKIQPIDHGNDLEQD